MQINRRDFCLNSFKAMALLQLSSCTLFSPKIHQHELVIQLRHEQDPSQHALLFFNLETYQHRLVPLHYEMHGILPIHNAEQFILTAKGAYLMLVDRSRVIHSLRSPDDIMFYGHTSYHAQTNSLLTSAIKYRGYDFKAYRRPKPKFANDTSYGHGLIYKTDLTTFKIQDAFDSGGLFPHDQHLNDETLTVINSKQSRENDNGYVSLIDVSREKVMHSLTCRPDDGQCATAHMYQGPQKQKVIVGVSAQGTIISYSDNELKKAPLKEIVQKNYRPGEMLNAAISRSGKYICAMNIDNGFLGLWDAKSLELLKFSFEKFIVSVNQYQDGFIVILGKEIRYYDQELNLKKTHQHNDQQLQSYFAYGPHSIVC
jgi:hypothetical protein